MPNQVLTIIIIIDRLPSAFNKVEALGSSDFSSDGFSSSSAGFSSAGFSSAGFFSSSAGFFSSVDLSSCIKNVSVSVAYGI